MSYTISIKYYNSFLLKKVVSSATNPDVGAWPGLQWNPSLYPTFPFGGGTFNTSLANDYNQWWYIEEARIKGGFNNTIVDLGARAYLTGKDRFQVHRFNYLIYSGVYNSRTSFNETNVFSVAEPIIKQAAPNYGSIQKLYAEDTNLIVFQESKVSRALINKNTIYSGDQGAADTSRVIGQIVPYVGEYGISKNPESFAIYGYRKYFTDKNKGVVLRLSRDGLEEISRYGMRDYFRDQLATLTDIWEIDYIENSIGGYSISVTVAIPDQVELTITGVTNCCDITPGSVLQIDDPSNPGTAVTVYDTQTNLPVTILNINPSTCLADLSQNNWLFMDPSPHASGPGYLGAWTAIYVQNTYRSKVVGGWDLHNKTYVVSMQNTTPLMSLSSGYSTLAFDDQVNGWVSFYNYKPSWMGSLRNKYFSLVNDSVFEHYDQINNDSRGLFYGTRYDASITFLFNDNPSVSKNFQTVNYEGASGWEVASFASDYEGMNTTNSGVTWNQSQDTTVSTPPGVSVLSYLGGQYDSNTPTPNYGLLATVQPIFHAGFDRKENRYVANLVNAGSTATARPGEVLTGGQVSGIKGYFATVKMVTDNTTDVGGVKELYAVGTNYVMSAY